MKPRGRPRKSNLTRQEQLRRAKGAQRERERAAGLVYVQLKLPQSVAKKLVVAAREAAFPHQIDELLDELVVRLSQYPTLSSIAWNRVGDWIPAREAFGLYERNWRFVELDHLTVSERELLDRLTERFGGGVINA